ncbi:MAG TPA: trypsin-like serine protease [Labilithrix sp.]|nr:trypsin-like serine protease [Labilithrix sp.]
MRAPHLRTYCAIALAWCAACGARAPEEAVETSRAAIQGGAPDTDSKWVLGVVNERFKTVCTGTLIGPSLVLTARHCLDLPALRVADCSSTRFPNAAGNEDVLVASCSNIRQLGSSPNCAWHRSIRLVRPSDERLCGADIALVVLREPIGAEVVSPALPATSSTSVPAVDTTFSAVGFGAVDAQQDEWGVRRRRDDLRLSCDGARADCRSLVSGTTVTTGEFVSSVGGICDGDSGGPAFLREPNTPVVFGLASRASLDGDKCNATVYTNVSAWRDWLSAAVHEESKRSGMPVPAWAEASGGNGACAEASSSASGCGGERSDGCATSGRSVGDRGFGVPLLALAWLLLRRSRAHCARK